MIKECSTVGMSDQREEHELLTTAEAAMYLRVSIDTLKNWRRRQKGPPFKRVGERLVAYRKADLDAWLDRT
jgi:excisionase family DNA binding protein